jgi:hypothetical protein
MTTSFATSNRRQILLTDKNHFGREFEANIAEGEYPVTLPRQQVRTTDRRGRQFDQPLSQTIESILDMKSRLTMIEIQVGVHCHEANRPSSHHSRIKADSGHLAQPKSAKRTLNSYGTLSMAMRKSPQVAICKSPLVAK